MALAAGGTATVEDDFIPLETMPTGRLQDHLHNLLNKTISILNLDAILPSGSKGFPVLKTFLTRITERGHVRILSIKHTNLAPECIEYLIEWISSDICIENLYVLGSIDPKDEKTKTRLEDAWKKHCFRHRTDNFGLTLMRLREEPPPPAENP